MLLRLDEAELAELGHRAYAHGLLADVKRDLTVAAEFLGERRRDGRLFGSWSFPR